MNVTLHAQVRTGSQVNQLILLTFLSSGRDTSSKTKTKTKFTAHLLDDYRPLWRPPYPLLRLVNDN